MDSVDLEIKRLLEENCSLRAVSRQLRISYGNCRRRAVIHGLHQPKLKKDDGGNATCIKCNRQFPIIKFPKLFTQGKYVCVDCDALYLHKIQIQKVGCTQELYQKLFDTQNGRCAICKKEFGHKTKDGKIARLAVDHSHENGKIRGLLCGKCNRGLGFLGEDNLRNALAYCQGHSDNQAD